MQWFRHYHGLSTDPKVASAAMEAEVHHTMAVAAWCFVLEHASEAEDRGSVATISPKVMAVGLRCTKDEAQRLLDAFEVEGMVRGGRIVAWDKRQPVSDNVAERVAEHRRRKAQNQVAKPANEPGNGGKGDDKGVVTLPTARRNVTRASEQNRTEQIREDTELTTFVQAPADERARPVEPVEPEDPPPRYAWEGDVIRLNAKHLNAWKASFPNIQVEAQLAALDAWLLTEASDRQRRDWFQLVPAALARKNAKPPDTPAPPGRSPRHSGRLDAQAIRDLNERFGHERYRSADDPSGALALSEGDPGSYH